jgi:aminoglycoside phosphotransferase (APT) family kinase protein
MTRYRLPDGRLLLADSPGICERRAKHDDDEDDDIAFRSVNGARGAALGWLTGYTEACLRNALTAAAPHLADLPIRLDGAPDLSKPLWASSRSTVGRRVIAKFAHSEETAVRIWREAQVLSLLGGELALPVPKLAAAGRNPVFSSTELVSGGAPLSYATVAAATPDRIVQFADSLATFLAQLHAVSTLLRVRERLESVPRLPQPGLCVSTDQLRARFMTMVEPRQRSTVIDWCDWIDQQLSSSAETVFVHGDFHPYNQLWDLDEPRLLAVVDFESSGLAEPEFDLRVLPAFGPGVDLLVSTVERYEAISGREVSLPRTMALFLLNYLGDALWRTEAGISLPEPGNSPSAYVKEAAGRLAALGIEP